MLKGKIVSQQVRMLLERMDLYPQEFVHTFESRHVATKWDDVLRNGSFNAIERFLIKRKYDKLQREVTQEAIVFTIMHDPAKELSGDSFFDTISRASKDAFVNNPYLRPTNKKKKGIK